MRFGDLSNRVTGTDGLECSLAFPLRDTWRTTDPRTSRACSGETRPSALADKLALEFGQCRHKMEDEPSSGRTGVETLGERANAHAACGQNLNEANKMHQRAAEAIEPPHDQRIAAFKHGQRSIETRARMLSTGNSPIFKDPCAPRTTECIVLQVEIRLVRGDACVTDLRGLASNLTRRVLAFYTDRGTAEQHIKEGKYALKWTRLSCMRFAANEVRFQLHALAYNLANFLRTLATPEAIERWSLTSLRERLIKTGARLVRHARYAVFQMAEAALPQGISAGIHALINRLRGPPSGAACA